MDADHLKGQLRAGFGDSTRVTVRRPGRIFQVEIPAYLSDGDAATIFIRSEPSDRMVVTDLGRTWMRLSYRRKLTSSVEAQLREIAERHHLKFSEGEIFARVSPDQLFATALALAQVQAEAEAGIPLRSSREVSADLFRDIVRDALRAAFSDGVELNWYDRERDPKALYSLDGVVPSLSLAISAVPTDLDAERAIATKYWLLDAEPELAETKVRWIALPRNLEKLQKRTQGRLEDTFQVPVRAFHNPQVDVPRLINRLAAA